MTHRRRDSHPVAFRPFAGLDLRIEFLRNPQDHFLDILAEDKVSKMPEATRFARASFPRSLKCTPSPEVHSA